MRRRINQKVLSCTIALILSLSVILSGCSPTGGSGGGSDLKGELRNASDIAVEMKAKYENTQNVNYVDGEIEIARDHQFIISIGFDPFELGMENYTDIAALYYDTELKERVLSVFDWASEDKKSYTISPWEYPGHASYAAEPSEYPFGNSGDGGRLFKRDPNTDWGNISTMYLVTKVDLNTGAPLEKPTVQVVTVKGELDTPNLSLEITDNGVAQFSWNKIKGAKAYYIVQFTSDENQKLLTGGYIGHTTDTKWSSKVSDDSVDGGVYGMNRNFHIYRISDDEWLSPYTVESYGEEFDPADGPVLSEYKVNDSYAVIAVNETGTSMYSRMISVRDIAPVAPCVIAYNMEKLSDQGFSSRVKGINMMPSYRWIVLCDGKLSQRIVNYDFSAVEEETMKWYTQYDDGRIEPTPTDVIKVPYKVDGTLFSGTLIISEFDKTNKQAQLDAINARQEALRNKTGDVKREVELEDEGSGGTAEKPGNVELVIDDTVITANSALSEFLAVNMLNGVKTIDLSMFPEALDQKFLIDAWSEAYYQNPLILGVSGAQVSRDGKTLIIKYEDDQVTREKKQSEINDKITQVVSKIATRSMTAREKEYAINQYLCDTVSYDTAALENAKKNDFLAVDSEFYDSFTAYGALINGVGVCASYAAAYKLLANACGLDCVVVTGYLEGSLGHAWNRVNLGSGRWATVDSTNNDSEIMPNAILNAPDFAIATTLVEDKVWILDSVIAQYSNQDDADEYYHVEGLFFEKDDVVEQIAKQLSSGDFALIRTDYMLTEAQFYEISSAVHERAKKDIAGFYWAGVIMITSDYALMMELLS